MLHLLGCQEGEPLAPTLDCSSESGLGPDGVLTSATKTFRLFPSGHPKSLVSRLLVLAEVWRHLCWARRPEWAAAGGRVAFSTVPARAAWAGPSGTVLDTGVRAGPGTWAGAGWSLWWLEQVQGQ